MANAGHIDIVRDRIDHWNEWRRKNTKVVPDFAGADLSEHNLAGANLAKADFSGAKLAGTNLSGANLARAKFFRADLSQADLSRANLFKANLSQPVLSVDSLQTAQLVGMLLHHEKARYEVFSITLNTALVIGRFPPERKLVLLAIKEALRRVDYSPLVLDFHLPGSGDKNEIVKTLGKMSRFVIADLTDDRRIAETLDAVVHFLPSIPIQPIGQKGREQSDADSHYHKYRWVLPFWRFTDPDDLAERIGREVIAPAEQKAAEIRQKMSFGV